MLKRSLLYSLILGLFGCTSSEPSQKEWAIALHGGAGKIRQDLAAETKAEYERALEEALKIGSSILAEGGSAVDAVEQVIINLENNPKFNAGKGSVFTHEGGHELDAAIMHGNKRQAGAACALRSVKNPIALARRVMQDSKHVMLAADGAERFAKQVGVERVDSSYFSTKRMHDALLRAQDREELSFRIDEGLSNEFENGEKYGTVGCVALDKYGQLVAGTSTGGLTNKRFGRVGDVPIIGSGTYADENVAVSMTGWGERIMLAVSGHRVASEVRLGGRTLSQACSVLLNDVLQPGDAGIIAVDRQGNIFTGMNTEGMFRASADSAGHREIGIW